MLSQDMHFFFGWLSNGNSQRRIDFIGLVFMVPIGAHSVSAIMKITTTCSLNALFFFGKLTYVLKENDTKNIMGIPKIYNVDRNGNQ